MIMKYIKKISNSIVLLLLAAASVLTACNEDIIIPVTDESAYEKAVQSYGYLRHAGTSDSLISVTLYSTGTARNIYLGVTKATADGMTVSVAIDTTLVQTYNVAHGTQYKPFPLDLAQISNSAKLSVNAWRMESDDVAITFTKNTARTPEGTSYLLPIKVVGETINMNADARTLWYVVNVEKTVVNPAKASGIISFCFVEVNNVNPLNVGIYKITNSAHGDDGKPFFDICSIFAANLSYDADKGRPYIFFNENVTPILVQRDKYIKPLQDMGIKVTLAILPNGASGLGFLNLTPQGAKDLAQEFKAICDAYGLDGVDFDEEYATYGINGLPVSNNISYGRLVYEVRQAMPDKLVNIYYIGASSLNNAIVEGQPVGNFISYGFGAYYGTPATNAITGLPNLRWGNYPVMLSNNQSGTLGAPRPTTATVRGTTGQNNIKSTRSTYGVNLMYNIVGYHGVGSTELNYAANDLGEAFVDRTTGAIDYSGYFTEFSKIIYDGAEVMRDHEQYPKDWLK
jgi:hypothetical protein